MALIAVAIAVTLATSFLSANSTTVAIARNGESHAKARYVAESGIESAIAYIRANEDWRTTQSEGTWVTDETFADGTFTIVVQDGEDTNRDGAITSPNEGDGDLADDESDVLTITSTAKVNGTAHVARTVVTPVPGVRKTVLFAVGDPDNLGAADAARKAMFQSWGYKVELIADSASQSAFDAATAEADLAYITTEASGAAGARLQNAAIGVVNEEGSVYDDLGIAASHGSADATTIDIVDNTHYITSPFSTGQLSILTSIASLKIAQGEIATDLVVLAEQSGGHQATLAVLEAGGTLHPSGAASGRRVNLPWGNNGFDLTTLTTDGKTMLKRALAWASTRPPTPDPVLHYDFASQSGASVVDRAGSVDLVLSNGNGDIQWVNDSLVGTGLYFNQNAQSGTAIARTSQDTTADDLKAALQTSNALTVQTFIKAEGFDNSYGRILSYSRDTGSTTRNLTIAADNDGASTADLIGRYKIASSAAETTENNIFTMDEYHVLALTVDVNQGSNNIKLYVDGELVKTSSGSGNFGSWTSEQFMLGNERTLDRPFKGYVYDVKIWDSALSAAHLQSQAESLLPEETETPQLIALYTFVEVPPPTPKLLHHWKLDETPGASALLAHWKLDETTGTTAEDAEGAHNGSYANGVTLGEVGTNGTAVWLDGTNDYVVVPHNDAMLIDSGTVSLWFKSGSLSGHRGLFSKDSTGYDTGGHIHVYTDGTRLKARLQSKTASYDVESAAVLQSNKWHYAEFAFGATGMTLSLDGSAVDTDPYTGGLGTSSGGTGNHEPIVFGSNTWNSGDLTQDPLRDYYRGLIDDVKLYNNSPADNPADSVADLYGAAMNGLTAGTAGRFGRAVSFDGSDDYVLIPHDASLLLDNGAVSFWFKSNSMSGHRGLFSKDSSDYDTGGHIHVYTDGSRVVARLQSTTDTYTIQSGSGLQTGVWYHVVVSFGSGGMKLLLNGSEVDSDSYAGGLGTSSGGAGNQEPIVLGANTWSSGNLVATPLQNYFTGEIDDVRIYDQPLNEDQSASLYAGGEVSASSGTGSIVQDTSGFGSPLNLTIDSTSDITWIEGGGLRFDAANRAASAGPASKLFTTLTETDEMTLEVRFKTSNATQGGPARIVSYSQDSNYRNFTFGQSQQKYIQRLRTTTTSANGTPDISSANVLVADTLQHVVVTADGEEVRMYRNESLEVTTARPGEFDWTSTHYLILGNERSNDRPWLGELYRVAIYDRALSSTQVSDVFAGAPPSDPGEAGYTYSVRWSEEP